MGHVTAESLRNRLYGEISTHEYPLPKAGSRCLFPVEFGDSWKDLSCEHPDYFEGVSTISQRLMSELVESLVAASNPYRRLAAAFDLNALVERKRTRLDAEFVTAKERLEPQIKQVAFQVATSKKALKLAMKAKDRSTALQTYLGDEQVIIRLVERINVAFAIEVCSDVKETVAAVKRRAEDHIDRLIEAWTKLRFDDGCESEDDEDLTHDMSWLDLARPSSPPSVGGAYEQLFQTLSKHTLADYYPWMPGSSFDDDRILLRSSGARAQSIAIHEATEWMKTALKKKRTAASRDLGVAGKKVTAQTAERERSERRHRDLLKRESILKKAHKEACKAMEVGIERSRMFRERMIEGHHRRDEELAKIIREEPKPSRRFLTIALRELHRREFPQALEGHLT